uniref:DDE Tnp4 domain-containing protein n=1 Tax=Plectus sambesii TaxID=2011161 RepID=A0A914W3M1_9BILA
MNIMHLQPTTHSRASPTRIQVVAALRFYATGTFQLMVGDYMHLSKASICRIVRDVSYALARMMNQFIHFPANTQTTKERFFDIAHIPNVVGAIDCTHVRVTVPKENQIFYVNRKRYHSINVQEICGPNREFYNIIAKYSGSTHDSRIFAQSAVFRDYEAGRIRGTLVGDAGYACKPYLLTPYDIPARNRTEGRFNKYHAKKRVCIEQAFGCLKRRFHVLHGEIRLPDPNKVCAVIAACCVLHNIAIRRRQPEFSM